MLGSEPVNSCAVPPIGVNWIAQLAAGMVMPVAVTSRCGRGVQCDFDWHERTSTRACRCR